MDREKLQGFLNSLGPLSFIGFILLQALQVVAAPVPGEVTGLIGGFLYGPFLGIILSTIGLTLGSWLAFFLSKTFGRPFVDKFVSRKTLDKYDYLLHHKGAFLVFVLFLIPGFPEGHLMLYPWPRTSQHKGIPGHQHSRKIRRYGPADCRRVLSAASAILRDFPSCLVLRSWWHSL